MSGNKINNQCTICTFIFVLFPIEKEMREKKKANQETMINNIVFVHFDTPQATQEEELPTLGADY